MAALVYSHSSRLADLSGYLYISEHIVVCVNTVNTGMYVCKLEPVFLDINY